MSIDRKHVETLLDARENDDAIAALCTEGPPRQPWQLALLARAYFQRGDSRGDLFSANFFADRATAAGFEEPWLKTLGTRDPAGAPQAARPAVIDPSTEGSQGGRGADTPYRFNALSVCKGHGVGARDFDWVARNIPCQKACPAGTDIPAYLTAIFDGNAELAYRLNLESNVFPGILGRVCARPCEAECRHGWSGLGDSVAICASKRAAADLSGDEPVVLDHWFKTSGRQVAVVGSGVAGLTAARELARWGHDVVVYEKHGTPGGMLNQGIPEFRLPRHIIDREIEQICDLGVDIRCGTEIGPDLPLATLLDAHDAVILAAGTLRPNILDLPGQHLEGVRHGLDFLLEANETDSAPIGRHVVVIGGGFTAMDCARTAKRLGAMKSADGHCHGDSVMAAPADHVTVWYRRTEKEMLITPGELEELRREAIDMEFLVTPVRYIGENGCVTAVEFIRTKLGEPDASGRRRPVPIEGSEFQVQADTVLLATGQFPDTGWIDDDLRAELVEDDGWLKDSGGHVTDIDKLFVAGDFSQGASSLIDAIGHAKTTARRVDAFLTGRKRIVDRVSVEDARETGRIREMDDVPVQDMPVIPVTDRTLDAEVETGYTTDLAVDETQRCYRCHYKYEIDSEICIYCDWCIKAKPRPECILKVRHLQYDDDGRIVGWEEADHSDETYLIWINQYDCIRCGACIDACPVDAISLQKVSLETVPQRCTDNTGKL